MAEPRIFTSADELRAAVGEQLGYTDWLEVDQKRIDLFAEATGDHQWIHVDPERAAAGPVRHDHRARLPTLSLLPLLARSYPGRGREDGRQLRRQQGPFPRPRAGRLPAARHRGDDRASTEVGGGVQVPSPFTIEREGGDKPVCVAESVSRYYL